MSKKKKGKIQVYYVDEASYYGYFEEICLNDLLLEDYPLIGKEIKKICQKMQKKIQSVTAANFFKVHAEVLGLDARLQLYLSLLEVVRLDSHLKESITEKQIIECSEKEYKAFLEEQWEGSMKNPSLVLSIL